MRNTKRNFEQGTTERAVHGWLPAAACRRRHSALCSRQYARVSSRSAPLPAALSLQALAVALALRFVLRLRAAGRQQQVARRLAQGRDHDSREATSAPVLQRTASLQAYPVCNLALAAAVCTQEWESLRAATCWHPYLQCLEQPCHAS